MKVDSAAVVPAEWEDVNYVFPYVASVRDRVHAVAVGYPENPRTWRTKCGWPFGIACVARPVLSLPACHKLLCDRCLKMEKEAAKGRAEAMIRETGGVASAGDAA